MTKSLYLERLPGIKLKVQLVQEGNSEYLNPLKSPEDVYLYVRNELEDKDREHFFSILLNAKSVPLGVNLVSIGDLTSSITTPREVFKTAILASASALILAHNHPSGDPTPSKDDLAITEKLKEAGALLGIKVLDHIIIGRNNYYSIAHQDRIF